ncbi:MAG: PTS sugar transporter subunit IIA, partial [Spirochaetaceae bacterium]
GNAAGVLGICGPGVDFDSLDGNPVHVIFLFVSDSNLPEEHLSVLTQIGRLSEMDGFYEEFCVAASAENAVRILTKYDARI